MTPRLRLKEKLFPVQGYFNSINDADFVEVIRHLSQGRGFGMNDCGCHFSSGQEPGEPLFEGARIYVLQEEIYVSWSELKAYVEAACTVHIKEHPEDLVVLQKLLDSFPTSNDDLEQMRSTSF